MPERLYSKEYQSVLIKTLGKSTKLRIIDFFMDNPLSDFTKKEAIDALGMSKQTFYNAWDELIQFDMVKETRRYGKARFYALNKKSAVVQKFKELDATLCNQAMEKAVGPIPAK